MDLFDFDNVKAEKASAMMRYNRLQSIGKLFRLVEACVGLLFLSWTCTRLPFAVKMAGQFLRQLAGVVASPPFVFFLCNAIIAALFVKSGKFSGEKITTSNADGELYEEFIKNSDNHAKPLSEDAPLSQSREAGEETVYEDKRMIISELNTVSRTCGNDSDVDTNSDPDPYAEFGSCDRKTYGRSKSEKLETEKSAGGKLRRSDTEKLQKREYRAVERLYAEDELSSEEFQRTIEAFIAKQLMFRRQESLSVILQNQT